MASVGESLEYLRELWCRALDVHDAMERDTSPAGVLVFQCFGWRLKDIAEYIAQEGAKAKSMKQKPPRVWMQDGIKQTRIDYDTPSEQNRIMIRCACTAREMLDEIAAESDNLRKLHASTPSVAAIASLFILPEGKRHAEAKTTNAKQPQGDQLGLKL